MTDDRDIDLAHRLDALETPDHRPGFWADLRAELGDTHADPSFSTDLGPRGGPELVEIGARRQAGPPPGRRLLLAAAAVLVVAVVTAGVVLGRDGDGRDADVATDPTPTEEPSSTTTTEPAGPLRPDGQPVDRGVGRPIAVDPTGTFLYVAAPAPDGGRGCEGAPAEAVYVERVDGDGSDRRLAIDPDVVDATGLPLLALSGTGEAAIVPRCEGYGARVVTATVAGDGTLVPEADLTINHLDLAGQVDGITDVEFASPGVLVAATWSVAEDGTEHRHLYSFPTSPSELTDLGQDGAIQVEVAGDGRLVVLTADGRLLVDGEVRSSGGEPGRQLAAHGDTIALASSNSVQVLDRAEERSFPVGGWDPQLVSAGTLVLTRLEGEQASVIAVDLASGDVTELVAGGAPGTAIAPDAGVVFAAASASDPEAPPQLVAQRLTR